MPAVKTSMQYTKGLTLFMISMKEIYHGKIINLQDHILQPYHFDEASVFLYIMKHKAFEILKYTARNRVSV